MQPLKTLTSRTVVMPIKDIDTDQIIPARFLTTTCSEGLGRFVFHDLRFNADGSKKQDFLLNQPGAHGCRFLVGGHNFGCGSSREHAPWALLDYGIQAVISTEIADIFSNNSLKNGLIPVVVDVATHKTLLENPGMELTIDLEARMLILATGESVSFPVDSFARRCLLQGIDQLGYLQQQMSSIERFEESRSWTP